jgi:hypothetical protein
MLAAIAGPQNRIHGFITGGVFFRASWGTRNLTLWSGEPADDCLVAVIGSDTQRAGVPGFGGAKRGLIDVGEEKDGEVWNAAVLEKDNVRAVAHNLGLEVEPHGTQRVEDIAPVFDALKG